MRIAVVGDTHGHTSVIEKELARRRFDYLLFTGDFLKDGLDLAGELSVPFYGVSGNCDRSFRDINEQLLRMGPFKIYIVHGHQYGVKHGLMKLYYRACELDADIVLFGHTHVATVEEIDGIWLINPGSPVNPRAGSQPSYVVINIEGEDMNADIHYLGGQQSCQ